MTKTKKTLILIAIIALGLFLRVYNIENAPPGIYPDEAVNGTDAMRAAETGNFQWFYPDNNGREGLYMNIMAVFFKFFGISILTFKLTSILFGTLTIWGVYLLAKELFRNARIGLIAAFLTSVSFWAINFSRIGFRAIMLPAILSFSFYFLLKGLRAKKWYYFAAGGFIFGLGLHTYIAFRIAPVILVVMLCALLFNRRHFLKNYWLHIAIFVIFTIISTAPMLYTFFVSHPEYLESRSASVSILSSEVNDGHPIKAFLKSFSLSLLKYNFWGDQNWRHNFPPYPLLDPLTGIAFMFGLIYSIIKFFHLTGLRFFKKIHDYKLGSHLLLLSSFFLMLSPEFLTAEGNPHALRAIGTLPFVFIFAALILNYFFEYAEKYGRFFQKIVFAIFLFMLLFIGSFNSIKYFSFWAKRPETAEAFDYYLVEIANYFKKLPSSTEKYFVSDEYTLRAARLLNTKVNNISYIWPDHMQYAWPNTNDFVFIIPIPKGNYKYILEIKERFPNVHVYTHEKVGGGYYVEIINENPKKN